ncbi:hypothetical protein [Halomonas rhizosphaerae]|uniref:Helix-turn-helix domain-containing protein n=1 Tax=Halomonas rhizosphaerae TaxID=3043296 RepID=A0ABT6V4E9_9GAMM|nr:hypothetical protein [Halomonas rhizosphaerae]MDI5891817.1 hypothetical protein [Halomonas rhizosphaerae]
MIRVETLARRAWQLKEQGYAIEDIADAMGKPTSAIELWISRWPEIAQQEAPWHEGLSIRTVHCLSEAGITSREALAEALESGKIQRDQPPGIGVSRLVELRRWLKDTGTALPEAPTRAMIIDLSLEAEAALKHLKTMSGQNASQLISRLLVEADEINPSD